MPWEFTAVELVAIATAVVAGALVQGFVGIGFSIVLVPVLALVEPVTVPAVPLLVSMPLTALIALRERGAVDTRGLLPLLAGRVLGSVVALVLLLVLREEALEVLFGVVIVGVALLSATRPRITPTTTARVGAGAASGLFGTTAGIGGPPIALLYQTRPGPELRATVSVVFLLGHLIALGALMIAGRLGLAHVVLAALLVPAMVAGFVLSRSLRSVLDGRWIRPAVLAFAIGAGLLAVGRGLGV